MLNRLTVSALVKAVIVVMAACVMAGLSISAWECWNRLGATSRMFGIADASSKVFKAMHSLRTDRSISFRLLNSDQPVDGAIDKFRAALKLAPDFAPAHFQLGMAFLRKGDSAQASAEFEKAHQLDPRFRPPRPEQE